MVIDERLDRVRMGPRQENGGEENARNDRQSGVLLRANQCTLFRGNAWACGPTSFHASPLRRRLIPEPRPFGETSFRAIVRAICVAEPLNVRGGG